MKRIILFVNNRALILLFEKLRQATGSPVKNKLRITSYQKYGIGKEESEYPKMGIFDTREEK